MSWPYRRRLDWWDVAWLTVVAITAIFVAVVAVRDCQKRRECQDRGGHVVEYNCHTVIHCNHSGSSTTCYPIESCEWRCEGLPAEDPR